MNPIQVFLEFSPQRQDYRLTASRSGYESVCNQPSGRRLMAGPKGSLTLAVVQARRRVVACNASITSRV